MKISKLFHWLYALVMLLPIFAIGSTCLISTFNMASKEETEIIYKYETNEVNSASDLIAGRIYHYEVSLEDVDSTFLECLGFYYLNAHSNISFTSYDDNYLRISRYGTSTNSITIGFRNEFSESYIYRLYDDKFVANVVFKTLYSTDDYSRYSICALDDIPFESVETHNLDTQEVFYRSVDKVVESPLFNWAYDSFLVAPFSFIVNLFSMPINSVIVELLSYWLAISIIWLVFDLIMYIPLLVHRWLDKGVLE